MFFGGNNLPLSLRLRRSKPILADKVRSPKAEIFMGMHHRPTPIVWHNEEVHICKGRQFRQCAVAMTFIGGLACLLEVVKAEPPQSPWGQRAVEGPDLAIPVGAGEIRRAVFLIPAPRSFPIL